VFRVEGSLAGLPLLVFIILTFSEGDKMRKLLLSLVALVFTTSLFAKDISVGYVLVGPSNDGGWSMRHSDGFKSLTKHG